MDEILKRIVTKAIKDAGLEGDVEIQRMMKEVNEKDCYAGKKVIKSIPAKKKWVEGYQKLEDHSRMMEKLQDELMKEGEKHNSMRKNFWTTIELELNDFTTHLHFNEKTNEIEFMEKVESGKPVKSPFV